MPPTALVSSHLMSLCHQGLASAIAPPNSPTGLRPPVSPGTLAQPCLWQTGALSALCVTYAIFSGVGEIQIQAPESPRLQECGANGPKAPLGNVPPRHTPSVLCNPPAQGRAQRAPGRHRSQIHPRISPQAKPESPSGFSFEGNSKQTPNTAARRVPPRSGQG